MKRFTQIVLIVGTAAALTACGSRHQEVSMATSPARVAPRLSPEKVAKMRAELNQRRAEFNARRAAEGPRNAPGPNGAVRQPNPVP